MPMYVQCAEDLPYRRLSKKPSIDIIVARKLFQDSPSYHTPRPVIGTPAYGSLPLPFESRFLGSQDSILSPVVSENSTPCTSVSNSLPQSPKSPVEHGFLRRFFSRQGSLSRGDSKQTAADHPEMPSIEEREEVYSGTLVPTSCVRPLLCNPEPREETVLGHVGSSHNSAEKLFQPDVSNAGEQDLITETRNPGRYRLNRSPDSHESLSESNVYSKCLRQREITALDAASDVKYIKDWGFFMKCYSEGRFNMSNPPEPPPRRPDFFYLPTPIPPDEVRRLNAFHDSNSIYVSHGLNAAHHLVMLALKIFHTSHASLSLIDRYLELMKAEAGFNRSEIPRSESLGAHVLLSNGEPMVILDTRKDWRFKGNPLVLMRPKIRFYAAAPIITSKGDTVGVFAICSSRPRRSFTLTHRHMLMSLAKIAGTDLDILIEAQDSCSKSEDWNDIPDPLSHGAEGHSSMAEPTVNTRGDTVILLEALEKEAERKASSSGQESSRRASSNTRSSFDDTSVRDHECADNSHGAKHSGDDVAHGCESQAKSSSLDDDHDTKAGPSYRNSVLTAESPIKRQSFRRGTPPLQHIYLEPEPIFASRSEATLMRASSLGGQDGLNQATEHDAVKTNHVESCPDISVLHDAVRKDREDALDPSEQTLSLVDVSFILSLIANRLDFELAYLLRIEPAGDQNHDAEPSADMPGFCTRIIASHGMPDPRPEFSSSLHLQALQQDNGLIFVNMNDHRVRDEVGYQVGIIMPVVRYDEETNLRGDSEKNAPTKGKGKEEVVSFEGSNSYSQRGVVLAAFKKDRIGGVDTRRTFSVLWKGVGMVKDTVADPDGC